MDTIITMGLCAFAAFALYRRPDWVAGSLCIALIVSTVLGWTQNAERLPGMLGLMDALASIAMLMVWTYYRSQRARIVGSIALAKTAWAVIMSSGGLDWTAYALVLNAAFVCQLIVAGGMADGLVAFLDMLDPGPVRKRHSRRDQLG